MKTNKFLMLLKTRGSLTAGEISKELGMTTEGARLQLLKLTEEELIRSSHESKGVGRPTQYFSLTELGNARFPDSHGVLTVKLIQSIKETLGEDALNSIIKTSEIKNTEKYLKELEFAPDFESRLSQLAEIRTREGYMAEYMKDEEGYLLLENHCPICAAAQECQGFCSSELNTFRFVLGNDVNITRIDHIIAGARRCAYRITLNEAS